MKMDKNPGRQISFFMSHTKTLWESLLQLLKGCRLACVTGFFLLSIDNHRIANQNHMVVERI
jgi:hypothetical protein